MHTHLPAHLPTPPWAPTPALCPGHGHGSAEQLPVLPMMPAGCRNGLAPLEGRTGLQGLAGKVSRDWQHFLGADSKGLCQPVPFSPAFITAANRSPGQQGCGHKGSPEAGRDKGSVHKKLWTDKLEALLYGCTGGGKNVSGQRRGSVIPVRVQRGPPYSCISSPYSYTRSSTITIQARPL